MVYDLRLSMKTAVSAFLAALLFALPGTAPEAVSDPSLSFLDDEIDLERVLSDLPPDFDLSTAGRDEIARLPFFSFEPAELVVAFRATLANPREITGAVDDIPGLTDLQKAVLLQASAPASVSDGGEVTVALRSGHRHDAAAETFGGGAYYLRLDAVRGESFSVTLLGERDHGEPRAVDLASGNLSLDLAGKRVHAEIGDFRPGYGQGLLFSRYGRSYVHGTRVMASEPGRTANTFFEESSFLRGGLVTVSHGVVKTGLFFSDRNLDATLDDDGRAVTIRESGIHAAGSPRGNLSERLAAVRIALDGFKSAAVGLTGSISSYSPVIGRPGGEAALHGPAGSTFRYLSFDGRYGSDAADLFFEHSRMNGSGHASIVGVRSKGRDIRAGVIARYYSERYWAYRSGGVSSFGETSNEKGVYGALDFRVAGKTRVGVSMDLARSLYRRYFTAMPASRKRLRFSVARPLTRTVGSTVSLRMTDDEDSKRWNILIKIDKKTSTLADVLRLHMAWSGDGDSGGPFVETGIRLKGASLRVDGTVSYFDIPSYHSRYYRYEYNVPGRGMTVPVWGTGGSAGIVLGWKGISIRFQHVDSDLMRVRRELTIQTDIVF